MVKVNRQMCPESKYSIKCPYSMKAEYITIHNTANSASAKNEVSYMLNNNNQVSYHCAVDDIEIRQAIPFDRNAWHAGDGNGKGNRASIGIEICYSTGDSAKFAKAEQNCAEFVASLLKSKGWGIDRVKKHQDWSGKYCPHKTLDLGWQRFLDMIKSYMGTAPQPQPTPEQIPVIKTGDPHVYYKVYANKKWLPEITDYNNNNGNGYAGIENASVQGFMIQGNIFSVSYRVHTVKGVWLPWVSGYDSKDANNGYAGILGKDIDGIQIITGDTSRDVMYRVSTKGSTSYLPWVKNSEDYAGILGKPIDKIQVYIKEKK